MIKCWEHFKCKRDSCPQHTTENTRCWLTENTHCHSKIQGAYLEKMELCLDCEFFNLNIENTNPNVTFKEISRLFKNYKTEVETQRDELEKMNKLLREEQANLKQKIEKATASIRKMQAKLIASSKMEALGVFAAGVAHNINNPLSGVLNCVRLMLSDKQTSELRKKEYLELSLLSLQHIEATVKKILEFTTLPRTVFEPCDIEKLVEDSVKIMQYKGEEKNVQLSFRPRGEIPVMEVDPSELQQVFMNLIANAIDAVDCGGKVEVVLGCRGKSLEIAVKDKGVGLSREDLKNIFKPFFSTKAPGSGVGLGLSISNSIVKRHKGEITVRSSVGKGSVFTVVLPIDKKRFRLNGQAPV